MYFNQALFEQLLQNAAVSPRRRAFQNLHQSHAEPVQKVLIAMHADSYVTPHWHDDKTELFVVLAGALDLLIFDPQGLLLARHHLAAGSTLVGADLPADTIHTLIAARPGVVFLEIKAGPFDATAPRLSPAWAAQEGTAAAKHMLSCCHDLSVGQSLPASLAAMLSESSL
jgi:cupin fold WbuC family metalloprotein